MSATLLLGLEGVLEEEGWGQSPRLYSITGTEVEPEFAPFAAMGGHPCDVLHGMWLDGVRPPEGAIGLALTMEGERHLRIEEVAERLPEAYAKMRAVAIEEYGDDEEVVRTAVEIAWKDLCEQVSPLSMPEDRRVHVRNSVAVLHTGWTIMVIRDQGGEPEMLKPVPPQRLSESRVPEFMWKFLTGKEPVD